MNSHPSVNFDQLTPELINKLKNAFELIDENGDGLITESDLANTFKTLGMEMSPEDIKLMLEDDDTNKENKASLNYPAFLSLLGECLNDFTQKREVIKNSFEVLLRNSKIDPEKGTIPKETLIHHLKEVGYDEPEVQFEDIFNSYCNPSSGDFKITHFLNTVSEE